MSKKAPKSKKPTLVYYIECEEEGELFCHGPFNNKPSKAVLKRYYAEEKDIAIYKLIKIEK